MPRLSALSGALEAAQTTGEASLSGALAGLAGMQPPAGVDAALFQQLKDELARQLIARGADKAACTPPTGEGNQVKNLAVTDNGDGSFNLAWHYRNVGDYNQDGWVNIADVSSIAMHFLEEVPPEDEDRNSLLAVIDGNGDGVINNADITPIAMNFGVQCVGYVIFQAPEAEGTWESLLPVPLAVAGGTGRLLFSVDVLPAVGMRHVMVVPHDSQQTGVASLPAELPGREPVVAAVTPLSGTEGEPVTFAAQVTGTPPFGFAWAFNGAVVGADTTAAAPTGTWGPAGVYDCSLTVSNSFGESSLEFTLTVRRWRIVTVDSEGSVGPFCSLAVIGGQPAISYCDSGNGDLKYVRAGDANGDTWGVPLVVVSEGQVGYYTSLAEIGGMPAICHSAFDEGYLKYAIAYDQDGETWFEPPTVALSAGAEYINLVSLAGNPAVAYYNWFAGDLVFVSAQNSSGSSWNAPVSLDTSGIVGKYASLAVVNGFPAVAYSSYPDGDLKYVRAADEGGTTWNTPLVVDYRRDIGWWASLAEVNGRPAISSCDRVTGSLLFVRAEDADGGAWGAMVTVDAAGTVGAYSSLAIVGGKPAIAYYDWGSGDLRFVSAADADGAEWNQPQIVDAAGVVGTFCCLAEVNGHPAIAYYDSTNADLKYAVYY